MRLLLTERVPAAELEPGFKVPPPAMVVVPTLPVPLKLAPLATLMLEPEIEPVTFSVPALTVVVPENRLVPASVRVPPPCLMSAPTAGPVPGIALEIALEKVKLSERLKISTALVAGLLKETVPPKTISLVSEPVVPPLPICNVPASICVIPVYVVAPVKIRVPVPDCLIVPEPEIAPA